MTSKNRFLNLVEVVAIVVAAVFCIRWLNNPQGPFEPVIAGCALVVSAIDLWRRRNDQEQIEVPPVTYQPQVQQAITQTKPSEVKALPHFTHASDCAFFAQRFSEAFPGVREPEWFQGKEAVKRLAILLSQPLKFASSKGGEIVPIWWLRFGNSAIDNFKVLSPTSVLIDHQEINVKRICAVYLPNYKNLFVYLEADPSLPTGLYPRTQEEINSALKEFGYVWEEYGLFKNTHLITRSQYDDNRAVILGEVVPLRGECELRTRYISKYNFVICANGSPINSHHFDQTIEKFMNRLLQGEDCLAELREVVRHLPSRHG